jgi:type 1 glutamine amidotransferase
MNDIPEKKLVIGIFWRHLLGRPVRIFKELKKTFALITILLMAPMFNGCVQKKEISPIHVLILTGHNNHEWEKTTAVLERIYNHNSFFRVQVTERPDTLKYADLKKFDVFVSNWNNWPENDLTWNSKQEADFLQYMEEGGGAVFFHAGASSYYSSKTYHRIGIGRWGPETSHGLPTRARVTGMSSEHPIMDGISDYYIMDEIWENTDIYPDAEALARLTAMDEEDGHEITEDAVFINRIGDGRSFYTVLGHDERALFNTGLQTLLLRGTEWAARGRVTIEVPQDLKKEQLSGSENYRWDQTDTSLQLVRNGELVWRYNFRNRFGKTYFHPLYLNHNRLTCESPEDHTWHPGLWFSWKFINEVNYWEYLNEFKTEETGFKSEGVTDLKGIDIRKNPDYSAQINLHLVYYPEGKNPVLEETRNIFVSSPDDQGCYYIDYQHIFNATYGDVLLDRTPILGEPDGKSWGGYGGLTIRFNQDFTETASIPAVEVPEYPKAPWFYMGFNSLTGETVGVAMFQHPDYTTPFTRWYYAKDPSVPFFFLTPAAIYDHNISLRKGESLALKYRVWILEEASEVFLDALYKEYLGQ